MEPESLWFCLLRGLCCCVKGADRIGRAPGREAGQVLEAPEPRRDQHRRLGPSQALSPRPLSRERRRRPAGPSERPASAIPVSGDRGAEARKRDLLVLISEEAPDQADGDAEGGKEQHPDLGPFVEIRPVVAGNAERQSGRVAQRQRRRARRTGRKQAVQQERVSACDTLQAPPFPRGWVGS